VICKENRDLIKKIADSTYTWSERQRAGKRLRSHRYERRESSRGKGGRIKVQGGGCRSQRKGFLEKAQRSAFLKEKKGTVDY